MPEGASLTDNASMTIDITHQADTKMMSSRHTSLVRAPRNMRRYWRRRETFVVAWAAL